MNDESKKNKDASKLNFNLKQPENKGGTSEIQKTIMLKRTIARGKLQQGGNNAEDTARTLKLKLKTISDLNNNTDNSKNTKSENIEPKKTLNLKTLLSEKSNNNIEGKSATGLTKTVKMKLNTEALNIKEIDKTASFKLKSNINIESANQNVTNSDSLKETLKLRVAEKQGALPNAAKGMGNTIKLSLPKNNAVDSDKTIKLKMPEIKSHIATGNTLNNTLKLKANLPNFAVNALQKNSGIDVAKTVKTANIVKLKTAENESKIDPLATQTIKIKGKPKNVPVIELPEQPTGKSDTAKSGFSRKSNLSLDLLSTINLDMDSLSTSDMESTVKLPKQSTEDASTTVKLPEQKVVEKKSFSTAKLSVEKKSEKDLSSAIKLSVDDSPVNKSNIKLKTDSQTESKEVFSKTVKLPSVGLKATQEELNAQTITFAKPVLRKEEVTTKPKLKKNDTDSVGTIPKLGDLKGVLSDIKKVKKEKIKKSTNKIAKQPQNDIQADNISIESVSILAFTTASITLIALIGVLYFAISSYFTIS